MELLSFSIRPHTHTRTPTTIKCLKFSHKTKNCNKKQSWRMENTTFTHISHHIQMSWNPKECSVFIRSSEFKKNDAFEAWKPPQLQIHYKLAKQVETFLQKYK